MTLTRFSFAANMTGVQHVASVTRLVSTPERGSCRRRLSRRGIPERLVAVVTREMLRARPDGGWLDGGSFLPLLRRAPRLVLRLHLRGVLLLPDVHSSPRAPRVQRPLAPLLGHLL